MRVSLDLKIHLGLGLALLILCVVGAVAYRATAGLVETADLVARTHEVLAKLEDLRSTLHDVEIAARGFLLTREESFRAAYHTAAAALGPQLDRLRALTADHPAQHERLDALEALLAEKLAGQPAQLAAAPPRPGNLELDAVHQAVATLRRQEETALRQRTAASRASAGRATLVIACGSLLGFVLTGLASWVISRDINARNRAEQELQRAKETAEATTRAKSEFLANVSHELRTPLNSVIGFANVLLKNRDGHLGDQELNYVRRIADNGKHLLTLINQVLDLSKVEAGRMDLQLAPVALDVLLRETVGELEGQARDKGLRLETDLPEGLAPLQTDAGKLKQVVINLVGNALKFTERGGVTVRVGAVGGRPAWIAVQDTGIGIPADQHEAIFEAFRQLDTGPSRRYEGSGLGLAIARALCQRLGYRLTVTSKVGEGSTFQVLLADGSGVRGQGSGVRGQESANRSDS
jgi:signal transduction histidine kinase